jgi:hypothetical protein
MIENDVKMRRWLMPGGGYPWHDSGGVPCVPGTGWNHVERSGTAWNATPLGYYPSVRVPGNSSSIPGSGDKTDEGWLAVVAVLALCLITSGATLILIGWYGP